MGALAALLEILAWFLALNTQFTTVTKVQPDHSVAGKISLFGESNGQAASQRTAAHRERPCQFEEDVVLGGEVQARTAWEVSWGL